MRSITVILCAQRSFGAAAFELLRKRSDISLQCVYAPVDDSVWRSAQVWGVPAAPAGTLRSDSIDADLIVCAHSHDFVSRAVRNRLRLGAIGYHPSLLPVHRGRDAVKWTIHDHDRVAGGSVYWLTDTVDGGPVAAQEWCLVRPDDDEHTLWRRELFPMGLRLLGRVLDDISRGVLIRREQDPALATWEPSFDGAPRLYRPELPQIGRLPEGWRVET